MISPRVFAVLLIGCAAAVALPATDKSIPKPVTTITAADIDDGSWFSVPLFGNLFAPLWRLFPSFNDFGPRIVADDDKFQVVVNVKDYKKDDLKVKVKGDFVFVQGAHEAKHEDHDLFASQFFHTYTLPLNASAVDVTAELTSDGFLVVTAPVTGKNETNKKADREVTIVDTGKPYKNEEPTISNTQNPETTATTATSIAETEDDRKEPTTPAGQKEETTENDNSIPHGNEVIPL